MTGDGSRSTGLRRKKAKTLSHNGGDNEVNIYRRMEQFPTAHPGRNVIRTLLDTFYIDGPLSIT
jgi:hypothetical protein